MISPALLIFVFGIVGLISGIVSSIATTEINISSYNRDESIAIRRITLPVFCLSAFLFTVGMLHFNDIETVNKSLPVRIINEKAIVDFENEEINLNEQFRRNFDEKEYTFVIVKEHKSLYGLLGTDAYLSRIKH